MTIFLEAMTSLPLETTPYSSVDITLEINQSAHTVTHSNDLDETHIPELIIGGKEYVKSHLEGEYSW